MKYEDDGFDPTPYDRILSGIHTPAKSAAEITEEGISASDVARHRNSAAGYGSSRNRVPDQTEHRSDKEISEAEDRGFQIGDEIVLDTDSEITPSEIAAEEASDSAEIVFAENNQIAEDANAAALQTETEEEPEEDTIESISQIDDEKENIELSEFKDDLAETQSDLRSEESVETGDIAEAEDREKAPSDRNEKRAEPETESTRIALDNLLVANELSFMEIKEGESTRIYLEEDIIVPDIKPDMARILSMDGSIRCADREIKSGQKGEDKIKVTGDIMLETIYIPEQPAAEPMVTIQSRIPFKTDWNIGTAPFSSAVIKPVIESIDYMVINERKFRAKLAVMLTMREYSGKHIELFEGIRGEDIEVLKEKVTVTDVLAKKSDILDIEEELMLKENNPLPSRILRYGINVVENHKQITPEKAVISGLIYCNILYLSEPPELFAETISEGNLSDDSAEEMQSTLVAAEPAFYQGKVEFTQFIPLDVTDAQSGSRITFDSSELSVKIKNFGEGDEEEAGGIGFAIEGSINTSIEVYKNVEEEIVTDVYHNEKELVYDSEPLSAKALSGSGVTELTAREILNIPAQYGDIDQVIYISGKVQNVESTAENGKETVSGNLEIELLALAADDGRTPFKMQHTIPFRGSMDIAGANAGMMAESDVYIKELWFDKINSKQIEVNAGILALGTVFGYETCRLIKNPCFVKTESENERKASMIIYISRPQDDLWKIAKKFRTTRERISRINGLETDRPIAEGMKLLIIK